MKSYAEIFADRRIYLLRHADAEPGDRMDPTRGLTKLGKKQAKAQAKFLDLIGVDLDIIITTTLKRAQETADAFTKHADYEIQLKTTRALDPDGTPEKAWEAIGKLSLAPDGESFGHVLVIGHGPLIQQILSAASYDFAPAEKVFSHGTMVKFQSDGTFHWLMTAKLAGKLVGIDMKHAEGETAELIEAAAALIESLDLPHKARVIDPLVAKLKRATRIALKAGSATPKWKAAYDATVRKAFGAGVRQAMTELGPVSAAITALGEARRPYPLPRLPDPKRMAELAALDIDWTDPDFSSDRALMIAEFEVSTAFHDGMIQFAGLWRGGNGPVEKSWNAEDDACEVCLENEAFGWQDEEAPFPSGDFEPPQHPNCRCSLSFRATPSE